MNTTRLLTLLALLLAGAACSSEPVRNPGFDVEENADAARTDSGSNADAGFETDADLRTGIEVEVLAEGEEVFDDRTHAYQLLRITDYDTGVVTYAQWAEPDNGVTDPTGVMVFALPYAGIDWSGEEVDERWAAKGDGLHPDEDAPDYDPGSSSPVGFDLITPREGVDRGMLFLVNNVATLMVYCRFYAGGDIQNEVDEMVAGFKYLEQRGDIDPQRVGINGGSWGGFEALYGAANAPDTVRPTTGIALYPLSDFELEWRWSEQVTSLPAALANNRYRAFFDPYLRRIAPVTGGAPDDPAADFTGFTHEYLAAELETPFIFVHDEHDVLVPFTQAQALRDSLGESAQYVWFRRPEPVDPISAPLGHGELVNTHLAALFALVYTPVVDELAPADAELVFTVATRAQFLAMLQHFAEQAGRGQSLYDLNALLAELAAPRVVVLEIATEEFLSGAEFVADTYNEAFGTSFTAVDVAEGLRNR
jgi:hypothetical protein